MSEFDRIDGRTINELRTITIENGHLESVDGSCKFSIGATCVDVSIVGPICTKDNTRRNNDNNNNNNNNTEANLDIRVQSEQGTITSNEIHLKEQILSIFKHSILLNKYPLTTIYIQVQIICNNGCLLMAILNSVSIALLDSGIDCKIFPISVCFGIINDKNKNKNKNKNKKKILFDPNQKEMQLIESFGTISFSTGLSSKIKENKHNNYCNLLIGDFKKRKRKYHKNINNNKNNNDSNNINHENDEINNEMDLIYCDIKGKIELNTIQQVLKQCKVACFTIQYFIKRHFVESFKSLPTIYVKDLHDQ